MEALSCRYKFIGVCGSRSFECVEIFVAMWQRFFNIWTDFCQMTTTSVGYLNLTLFILRSHNWLANCDLTSLCGQRNTAEFSKPDVLTLLEARGFLYKKAVFFTFEISGFRRGTFESSTLLECHVAYIGSCLPTFRDKLLIQSSRVRQSTAWPLKMGPIICPDKLVNIY